MSYTSRSATIEHQELSGYSSLYCLGMQQINENYSFVIDVFTNSAGTSRPLVFRVVSLRDDSTFGTVLSSTIISTSLNPSNQILIDESGSSIVVSFYSPGTSVNPFMKTYSLGQTDGRLTETGSVSTALPSTHSYLYMSTAMSSDGLKLLSFDLTKTDGTYVRYFRRSSIDSAFTLVSNLKFSGGYASYLRTDISSDGKYLIYQECSDSTWTGAQTAKIFSISLGSSFEYSLSDSITVPNSAQFEYKTSIHPVNEFLVVRETGTPPISAMMDWSTGKFLDASWILRLSSDNTFVPAVFDNGRMSVSTDGENYVISI